MKTVKVGRSSGNDIVIQNDYYVGRTHCQFIQDDNGNYRVIDLNSTNGTFINGVRRSGETRLQSNDTVRIGNTMLPWQSYFSDRTGGSLDERGEIRVDPAPPQIPTTPSSQPIMEEQKGKKKGIAALVCGILGIRSR